MAARTTFCIFLFIAGTSPLFGQLSIERIVVNRMQKGKWKSAEESLKKSLRKDTLNPEAKFLFSWFYFYKDNPAHNIDSAYVYSLRAFRAFSASPPKEKERLRRYPLDSVILAAQRKQIDSAAFEATKSINTESAYQDFLSKYRYSDQQTSAIELRNEVAFVDALKLNSYKGFLEYLNKYPASIRAVEARTRYDKLLFEDKTHDGKLGTFESFYREYPQSPFRKQADQNIFEITTAGGRPGAFAKFVKQYPASSFRLRAQVILYHLAKDEEIGQIIMPLTDSLRKAQQVEQGYWVPVLRNGKFGFMDQHGKETVHPKFDNLLPAYLCGNIREDYLVVGDGVISRSGDWIYQGAVKDVNDMGIGFLKINLGNCVNVLHKSGFALPGPCFEDSKMIGHNFIATKQREKWGLVSLAGKILLTPQYDDIVAVDGLIILSKGNKKIIVTIDQVGSLADQIPLPATLVFDDFQRIAFGNYLVKNGSLEGLLNDRLEFIAPLDRQAISKVPNGYMLEKNRQFRLVGFSEALGKANYDLVQFYGNWIKLKLGDNLLLYDLSKGREVNNLLDSIRFENKLAFAWKKDSLRVYLNSAPALDFESSVRVSFIKSADSTEYFFVPERTKTDKRKAPVKNNKTVFNARTGVKLFISEFDAIEYIGQNRFLISKGSKKGLLTENGKAVLQTEYAAIVPLETGLLSLLKDKKFGLYNIRTRKLLKPVYDRNLVPIATQWIAAYKDGGYGLIDWDARAQGKFDFEEIRPWNDSLVIAKKDFYWMLYNIYNYKIIRTKIMDYSFVMNTPSEKVAIIHQDLHYGVVSSKKGEVIPASFSDIVNVGSDEEPLYFAEKNVEEAGIYVVIYYDQNGKLLRKQVYEESEYERIYCADNN